MKKAPLLFAVLALVAMTGCAPGAMTSHYTTSDASRDTYKDRAICERYAVDDVDVAYSLTNAMIGSFGTATEEDLAKQKARFGECMKSLGYVERS